MPVMLKELISNQPHTVIDSLGTNFDSVDNQYFNNNRSSYNSDNTTGFQYSHKMQKMTNQSLPVQYQQNIQSNYPTTGYPGLLNSDTRNISFDKVVTDIRENSEPIINVTEISKPYAGDSQDLKDARINDNISINLQNSNEKKEYFNKPNTQFSLTPGQSCVDTLNHVMNCPMCSKYFKCDNKVYNVLIIMLIILFCTVIFFVAKDNKKI
jgi:hypothetical protein